MTRFGQLPVTAQNALCFGALLCCFLCLADCILLWREKRRWLLVPAALDFLCAYVLVHLCRALTEMRLHGTAAPQAAALFARMPFPAPVAALALLLALASALLAVSRRWRETHITPAAIRESVDGLPAGICCYLPEGRCVLVNHRMNAVCLALTGRDLQNGAAFYEAVREEPVHVLPDGTAVSFRHRRLLYESAPLYELIADDITELYRKSEQLRQDNARARRLRESMRAYGETIGETVRKQELLDAKIRIHDGMNSVLLATQKTLQPEASAGERKELLQLWRSQAALLGSPADRRTDSGVVADLNALSGALGIALHWDGALDTDDAGALRLFLLAAREAMANALRHAQAENLFIRVRMREQGLEAAFTNDGRAPSGPVRETGGLANLRRKLESDGGDMQVQSQPEFRLQVQIPTGGKRQWHTEC